MLGILTGISYVSGLDYYRGINTRVTQARETGHLMAPNPPLAMVSVDCDIYAHALNRGAFDEVTQHLLDGVERLVAAGCDWLAIASNTGHLCVPAVEQAFPDLSVLHIADCCALELRRSGFNRVGLIGTKPTMEEDYLKDRFRHHGIETIVPAAESTREELYRIIREELSFERFTDSARNYTVRAIHDLGAVGAQACVSGCTEIELLVQQEHVPEVPWIPSAERHIQTIADVLLGTVHLEDLVP